MVKVSVPATSANIGSGFDSCGLALSLYNTAAFEEFDGVGQIIVLLQLELVLYPCIRIQF